MREREAAEAAVEEVAVAQPRGGPEFATRLMALQRSAGNRAVVRMLARDAWSDAVKYEHWKDAAKSLGDLKDKDVNDKLGELNVGELGALLGGTRDWGTDRTARRPGTRRPTPASASSSTPIARSARS